MSHADSRHVSRRISRRQVLTSAAATAFGAPLVLTRAVSGVPSPNSRINVAMIGTGRQAYNANLPFFLWSPECQVVAVCDVDSWRMGQAKAKVEQAYADKAPSGTYKGCDAVADFREVLARKDVDAVMISTPDHWHVYMAIEAAKAGKDVALEKPISLSVEQGRKMVEAVKKSGVILRTDSEARYSKWFHRMAELARNGRLGTITKVTAGIPKEAKPLEAEPTGMSVPAELNYEMWLGPAPEAPYNVKRVHARNDLLVRPGWMQFRNHCEGMITNWGAHIIDIVQWGLGTEETGPVEVEGKGAYPEGKPWEVLKAFEVRCKYANGVELHYSIAGRPFIRFEGTEGWMEVEWNKKILAEPKSLIDEPLGQGQVRLPLVSEKEDFVNCVRSRKRPVVDAEIGHRTQTICQIGHIAIDVGRKLKWDPAAERFVGDDEANQRLGVATRSPWAV